MKFLDRLKAAVKITLGELPRNYYFGMLGGGNSLKRASVEVDPYGNLVGWVFFAIDKVAQRVGGINVELFQLGKGGSVEQVEDHELLSLIYRANPTQTKFDLFYLTTLYLRIWGSAPWYLEMNGKKIINIWPLRPDLLRVLQTQDGTVTGYEYRVGVIHETLKADEVINIRKSSPQNPLIGFSVLLASALEIDADVAAAVWNRHVLENSAEPGGVLTTEGGLTDEQYNRLVEKWEARYAGPTNAGRTAILEAGLKYQKISQTQQELDFIESRKFNRDSILTMLGVPKALVIADDVNRANAEVAERVFAKETIEPIMRLIVDQLNEFFVTRFGDNFWLDFESPVSQDRETKRLEAQAGTNVWQTVNETRAEYNLPPLEGGDELYMPLSLVPQVGSVPDPIQEPKQHIILKQSNIKFINSKHKKIKQAVLARSYPKRKFVENITEKVVQKISEKQKESSNKIKVKLRYKDELVNVWDNIMEERKMYVKKLPQRANAFEKVMRKFFGQQEDEVIKNLKKSGEPKVLNVEIKSWIDKVLFRRKDNVEELIKVTAPLYQDNIKEGSQDIAILLGVDLVDIMGNAHAVEFLKTKPIKFAEAVNDTTLEALRNQLSEGVEAGESVGELGNRIAAVFEEARSIRTETIARTEVGSAMNFGRNEQMSEQGIKRKQWLAIFSNTREAHAEANGQVVDIGDNFVVGGEELAYPQDPAGSPENVINCQCSVVPVIE